MKYYAVPNKCIYTFDKSTNPYRSTIFSSPKVKTIDMPQIIDAFNSCDSIRLFSDENAAKVYIESKSREDDGGGYITFTSPPLLQVDYNGDVEKNGQDVKPSEVNLISGKMLFVGLRKFPDLPYRSVKDVQNSNPTNNYSSSDFDIRVAPFIFIIGATLG